MEGLQQITTLPDKALVEALTRLAASERRAVALLIATLAEFDARRLFLGLGYSSLFDYCTRALHLSEQATYTRIEAARASRRFPIILKRIAEGGLSLTAARLLAPHLTDDNCDQLLDRAAGQTTRVVERIVATIRPQEPVPSTLRKLPATSARAVLPLAETPEAVPGVQPHIALPAPRPMPQRAVVRPLSDAHYKLQVTISASTHDKLRQAQALMRHSVPNGDPAAIVERALDVLLIQLRRSKFAETSRPRTSRPARGNGRHIPAAVKREVSDRDGRRCVFLGPAGVRCDETGFLEYHHVEPYAKGGASIKENIQLRCRAHNAYEAELLFGKL